ncbi:hypothetical protein KBZ08_09630 [Cyanobium sp. Candia 9D4]|uniref:hypothetical protein n=1 Tax=Cyanobium sp. Candia 9D4 TaxID=2823707 RepID=UPI0020CE8CCE|nr:hypothetical protein [Cyanobium sp. Candia 9D4]MCP9934172.1 hypothetical protein [Cyanobium sp. Candia 9D4]
MTEQKSSFWSTLPGILTALGGLLAGVAGLVTALYTAGIIGTPSEKKVPPVSIPATQTQPSDSLSKGQVPVLSLSQVDRTDAKSTAYSILNAYRARDVIALAGLVSPTNRRIFVELAEQGESHPRYSSIFGDASWRSKVVQSWDGNLGEVRYRHYVGAARNDYEAQVEFAEAGPNELAVVTLTWLDGKWNWEDINSPSRQNFMKGRPSFSRSEEPY